MATDSRGIHYIRERKLASTLYDAILLLMISSDINEILVSSNTS